MARTTAEDCLEYVSNRYELVLVASRRARQIASGLAPQAVEDTEENEKPTVTSLREIGEGVISPDQLETIEEEANSAPVQVDFESILRGFEEADREMEEKADLAEAEEEKGNAGQDDDE